MILLRRGGVNSRGLADAPGGAGKLGVLKCFFANNYVFSRGDATGDAGGVGSSFSMSLHFSRRTFALSYIIFEGIVCCP